MYGLWGYLLKAKALAPINTRRVLEGGWYLKDPTFSKCKQLSDEKVARTKYDYTFSTAKDPLFNSNRICKVVVSKTRHSEMKTEARSTQNWKTKHPRLENEAPKSRKRNTKNWKTKHPSLETCLSFKNTRQFLVKSPVLIQQESSTITNRMQYKTIQVELRGVANAFAVENCHRWKLLCAIPSFQVAKNFENRQKRKRRRSAWVGQADFGKL